MVKIISCASYYGTGSSAITDFFSEFDNVYSLSDYEFRFLQDPDGISDLEYNLIENHNRHNSGHALKRFKRLVDFNSGTWFNQRYEPFFNNQYKKLYYKYIDKLTEFTYKGHWFYDFYDRGALYYYYKLLPGKIWRLFHPAKKESTGYNALPNEITYYSKPTYEEFVAYTKEYILDLMAAANSQNKPYMMVDQLLPPSNVERYTKYFDDLKLFVVDRDPRDLYILSREIWKDNIVPKDTVELFCRWFEYTRNHRKTELYKPDVVMFVRFEDLVFNYEETTQKMRDWAGLTSDEHTYFQQKFNPSKSIKNTRLWIGRADYESDVSYIEKHLSEYLYPFDQK